MPYPFSINQTEPKIINFTAYTRVEYLVINSTVLSQASRVANLAI